LFQIKLNSFGQALFDLVLASFIFLLVLISVISLYQNALIESNSLTGKHLLQQNAFFAVEKLLNSKGFPEKWNEISITDVNYIGLLDSEGFVSEEKLIEFNLLDYDLVKAKLGIQAYEFYFYFNGFDVVEKGIPLNDADFDSVVVRRVVPYKGGEAVVDFTVYKFE